VTVKLAHDPTLPSVDAVATDSRPVHCPPAIASRESSPSHWRDKDSPLANMATALVFFPRK